MIQQKIWYILHSRGAIIGDIIISGTEVPIKMGIGFYDEHIDSELDLVTQCVMCG